LEQEAHGCQVLEPDLKLSFEEIWEAIQQKYPYFASDSPESVTWKTSVRSCIHRSIRTFSKGVKEVAGKKVFCFYLKSSGTEGSSKDEDEAMVVDSGAAAGAAVGGSKEDEDSKMQVII